MKIVGISGSLRAKSFNSAALRAAQSLAPEGVEIEIVSIDGLPVYSGDLEAAGLPPAVESLAAKIAAADAVLFVTPEYNYSISGALKNAIDWLSRAKPMPLAGKPAAIMGASMGLLGTARAQYHLRQMMVFLDMHPVNKPEVMIASAHEKFDDDLNLTHDFTKKLIGDLVVALKNHAG